uniref:purine-cytosine permease family protein n=1 Tax=Castellaniella defragrans TaxID=75697 RepID=UPI0033419876
MVSPASSSNQSLIPLPDAQRVFGWRDHAALWFSLGVGLLVMQVGAYLVPALGMRDALAAVVFGSILGAGLLAWTARLGCDSGLSSAGLMHVVYGSRFARLPVFLNIVQLVGWATFELVVMRDGTIAIGRQAFGLDLGLILPTLFWGLVIVALLCGSMVTLVRRFLSRFGLPLVVASLVWLSVQFLMALDAEGLRAAWLRPGTGGLGVFGALDLVIAMPVSWLPLVADYARHGRHARGAFAGTWLGYTLANIWCYALGVLVITVAGASADMIGALLLAQGGLVALGLILIDELDNTYGDLYSGSISAHSITPRLSARGWGVALAALSTVLAMILPMHSLEPFLLALSSVFVPLFGTILGRLGFTAVPVALSGRGMHTVPAAIWVLGIVCYHALALWMPQYGSALPTLALTFALGALSVRAARQGCAE